MSTRPAVTSRRRRDLILVLGIVALVAVVYTTVVVLYARSGTVEGAEFTPPRTDGVTFVIEARSVEAGTNRLSLDIELAMVPDGVVVDDADELTLIVAGAAGERTLRFRLDEIAPRYSVDIRLDGEIEQWPFDVHRGDAFLIAYVGEGADARQLDTFVIAEGDVPGWALNAEPAVFEADDAGDTDEGVRFTAQRSGSTIAFGVVLLALMIVMPTLVLTVAITALRGRRRIEASFMSWMGAMLFATIPLRTFLPGSPPIGSWIDFLVVLWVIAGLVAGLVIYVIAWLKWSPRPEVERPEAEGPDSVSGVPIEEGVDLVVVDPGEGTPRER